MCGFVSCFSHSTFSTIRASRMGSKRWCNNDLPRIADLAWAGSECENQEREDMRACQVHLLALLVIGIAASAIAADAGSFYALFYRRFASLRAGGSTGTSGRRTRRRWEAIACLGQRTRCECSRT